MGVPIIGHTTILTLFFADDQVVIAQDQEDTECMLRKLKEEYEKWGLEINFENSSV